MYQTTRLGEFLDPDREKVGDEARQAAAEPALPDTEPAEPAGEPRELSEVSDKNESKQNIAGGSPALVAEPPSEKIPPPEI
jgi:hypothetical protein